MATMATIDTPGIIQDEDIRQLVDSFQNIKVEAPASHSFVDTCDAIADLSIP